MHAVSTLKIIFVLQLGQSKFLSMSECNNALMVQVIHVEDFLGCAQRMLQLAACAERTSTHPLAAAIVGHAALNLVDLDLDVTSTDQLAGDKTITDVVVNGKPALPCLY